MKGDGKREGEKWDEGEKRKRLRGRGIRDGERSGMWGGGDEKSGQDVLAWWMGEA